MNKRRGTVLIELLCVVGLLGIFLSYMVLQMGDVEGRLQNMQVNLAARRLIMDARGVQEYNMFDKDDNGSQIVITPGNAYYTIRPQVETIVTRDMMRYFADFGCAGVRFKEKQLAIDLTEYKPTSSVDESKYLYLVHRDDDFEVGINLQPVTGRIEIAQK